MRVRPLLPALMGLAIFAWKTPHVGLFARIACGDIGGDSVPVTEFAPEKFQEETVALQAGALILDAPRGMIDRVRVHAPSEGVALRTEGLAGLLLRPQRQDVAQSEDEHDSAHRSSHPGGDEVALTAAAYATSSQEFSFGMSEVQVESLEALLKAKRLLTIPAERVEIVRTKDVKGLLLFQRIADGRTTLTFDYSSPDGRMRGLAVLLVDERSGPAMTLARALLSSLRFDCG